MKISRLTLTHVRVPLHEPFQISSGAVSEKDSIIVSLDADGATGHGEASPMPSGFYSALSPEGTWNDLVERIVPSLARLGAFDIAALNAHLDQFENFYARAGIETAFWDLWSNAHRKPLCELLGAKARAIESGLAVGIFPTIKELLAAIDRYMVDGYKRIKIKIQPGWDVVPVRAVRAKWPDYPLMVDANAAYKWPQHREVFKALDAFKLMMFEQPLAKDDIAGHAALARECTTPVCMDESLDSPRDWERAITAKAFHIANIKIQRVGGLWRAKQLHDRCRALGLPCWMGTMPEMGVGGAHALHMAALPGCTFPTDVESSMRWFVDDIIEPLITVKDGLVHPRHLCWRGFKFGAGKARDYLVREQIFDVELPFAGLHGSD